MRQRRPQLREKGLDAVHHADDVRARLPLDVDDHRRGGVHPGRLVIVLGAVHHVGNVGEPHGAAVLVRHDDRGVVLRRHDLIVRADGERLPAVLQVSLGLVHVGLAERGPQIFEAQPVGRQGRRVSLDPHGRPLPAADRHQPHSRKLRYLLRERGVGVVLHLPERHAVGGQRQRDDGGVGGVAFAVDRRVRQIFRQIRAGGVDGGLHLLLGYVDIEVEIELQDHDRAAERAERGHLLESGHLPELALQRSGDGGRHHFRARPGVKRLDLNGRIIDFRQGRNGQLAVGNEPRQKNARHQERGRNRPQNERPRRTHEVRPPGMPGTLAGTAVSGRTVTLLPSSSLSWPSVTTRSPGARPLIIC